METGLIVYVADPDALSVVVPEGLNAIVALGVPVSDSVATEPAQMAEVESAVIFAEGMAVRVNAAIPAPA